MPLQGVCDPVTGNTPLMYAAMENKVIMLIMVMMMVMMVMMVMMTVMMLTRSRETLY